MQRRRETILGAHLLCWLVIAAMVPSAASAGSAKEGVEAGSRSLIAAIASGDGGAASAMYTETAFLLPPNAELLKGWESISEYWQEAIDGGLRNVELETLELTEINGTAIEVGRYKILDDATEIVDRGKYLAVWSQEGDRWLMHRDIWNSSLPSSAP